MAASPSAAAADPWVNRDVDATRVYVRRLWLDAGQRYHFRTESWGDPVLHLWREYTRAEVAYNDDAPGSLNPWISYTVPVGASGWYWVVGRSYATARGDDGDVKWCIGSDAACTNGAVYTMLDSGVGLRGFHIEVAHNVASYQTAMVNPLAGGTYDTVLLGVDDVAAGHLMAWDDDSGAGRMDMITAANGSVYSVTKLIVGAYSADGKTNVFTNDRDVDRDGDGLGTFLEYYLGTCDDGTYGLMQPYCAGRQAPLLADSDRDGLADSIEVFGVDHGNPSLAQHLPAWGADPLRKDIFLEQDYASRPKCSAAAPDAKTDCWDEAVAGNPFTETLAAFVAARYAAGSRDEVLNIQGDGIALHFDIGKPCTNYTLCGDWGGGGQTFPGEADRAAGMDASRHRTFRYLGIYPEGGQAGLGNLVRAGIRGWRPAAEHQAKTVTHELGHSLGLEHWGHDSWGWAVNCKPNYPSLMNYAFDPDPAYAFSHGSNPAVLDPARASELAGFGGMSALHLDSTSTSTSFGFPVADATGRVDWNRSGDLGDGASGSIRAGVSIAPGDCGTSARVETLVDASPTHAGITPETIGFEHRQYAFWADGSTILYTFDPSPYGPDDRGSCTGGTGHNNPPPGTPPCNTWLSPIAVPIATTRAVTGLAVAEWNGSLVLAYTTDEAKVYVETASGVDPSGVFVWRPASGNALPATLASDTELDLSVMFVSHADFGGAQRVLGLFLIESGDRHVWYWTTDPIGLWWTRRQVHASGSDEWLPGRLAAAVSAWPNESARPGWTDPTPFGGACGLFPRPTADPLDPTTTVDRLMFYCYDRASDRWEDLSAALPDPFIRTIGRKSGVAFHTFRESAPIQSPPETEVAPLANDSTHGQFWVTYVATDRAVRTFLSTGIHRWSPPGPGLAFSGHTHAWDDAHPALGNAGLSLYEDGEMSAVKGLLLTGREMRSMPLFDGTFHATLTDGNDFHAMERGICRGLWFWEQTAMCGASNVFGY